ncbi:MAG: AEC family transporter [Gammaproteobacteria bacterium]|nr:AEC family transporter [Gammaproteobacteria bacterium]NNC97074.1 AEC family transporter [Gammaproteobacteria bacterium]NNM14061.1 AEC family transporter [Gammaproteobacteria bacterium]
MLETILIASPIFGIAIFGFAAARLHWVSGNNSKVLTRFVFYFAVPLFLLRKFVDSDLPDVLPLDLLASFYIPVGILYIFSLFVTAKLFRHDRSKSAITAMSSTFGNTVLLGLPVLLSTYGEDGVVPFFIILAFHGLSLFTVTTILLERAKRKNLEEFEGFPDQKPSYLRSIFQLLNSVGRNPILVAIVLGLVMNSFELKLPYTLDKIAEIMGDTVTGASLFALGATMSHYRLSGQLGAATFIAVTKVLVLPLLAWVFGTYVFALPHSWLIALVIFAAQPTGVSAYVFAEQYKTGVPLSTTTVMLSTIMSMLSLPAIIYWIMQ